MCMFYIPVKTFSPEWSLLAEIWLYATNSTYSFLLLLQLQKLNYDIWSLILYILTQALLGVVLLHHHQVLLPLVLLIHVELKIDSVIKYRMLDVFFYIEIEVIIFNLKKSAKLSLLFYKVIVCNTW